MNLFDMARRGDPIVALDRDALPVKVRINGQELWRGIRVGKSLTAQICLKSAPKWYPFNTRPETVGWYARTTSGDANLSVQLRVAGTVAVSRSMKIGLLPSLVYIPWPLISEQPFDTSALELHFDLAEGQIAELLVHKCLDRSELISLAKGTGIEIGPGPRPQIMNGPEVNVKYVEEMSAGEWKDLYDKGGKYSSGDADWSNHIVGKADNLPCADDSLDFIFSSHVFEHLANPIGHLEHWASKLKSGGIVIAIVPDLQGTKDYKHTPSLLEEFIEEYRDDVWEPTLKHYERWADVMPNWSGLGAEAMTSRRSIHVHFYCRESTASILKYATIILPFKEYHIRHTANHRDFYWVLVKK